jgi:hypothetical protein
MRTLLDYVCEISDTNRPNKSEGNLKGTGFRINSKGDVATCWHVVKPLVVQKASIYVRFPYQIPWLCDVYNKSEEQDIVLLRTIVPITHSLSCAELHPNWREDTKPGDSVMVWGYSTARNKGCEDAACIQFCIRQYSLEYARIGLSGNINPGDSGGPVINAQGKVIGIASAKDKGNAGHAMAIPISFLLKLLQEYVSDQIPGSIKRCPDGRTFIIYDHEGKPHELNEPHLPKQWGEEAAKNAEHWKQIHALVGELYEWYKEFHISIIQSKEAGELNAVERADEHKGSAQKFLWRVRQFIDFKRCVLEKLPASVSENVQFILQMPVGCDAIMRSLGSPVGSNDFTNGVLFAQAIDGWLLHSSHMADTILQEYISIQQYHTKS